MHNLPGSLGSLEFQFIGRNGIQWRNAGSNKPINTSYSDGCNVTSHSSPFLYILDLISQEMASKLIFAAFMMLATLASQAMSRDLSEVLVSMIEKHEQWMSQYGRVYKDDAEKANRYKVFKENVKFIESFNKDESKSYKLGINQFADLTNEEFGTARNKYKPWRECKGTLFRYENVSCSSHHGLEKEGCCYPKANVVSLINT